MSAVVPVNAILHTATLTTVTHGRRMQVEDEIRLLFDRLRTATASPAASDGDRSTCDPDASIPKANGRDKAVYSYLTSTAQVL